MRLKNKKTMIENCNYTASEMYLKDRKGERRTEAGAPCERVRQPQLQTF